MRGTIRAVQGVHTGARRFAIGFLTVLVTAVMVLSFPLPGARASALAAPPSAAAPTAVPTHVAATVLQNPMAHAIPTSSVVPWQSPVVPLGSHPTARHSAVGTPITAHRLPGPLAHFATARSEVGPASGGPTNYLVDYSACSFGPTIAQTGASSSSLVGTSESWISLFNSSAISGASECNAGFLTTNFFINGTSNVFRSFDGGHTWTTSVVGPNATWSVMGTPANGSIHSGLPTIGASPSTSTVLFADTWEQACTYVYFNFRAVIQCGSTTAAFPQGVIAPAGVDIARSTNGGKTFGAPMLFNTGTMFQNITAPLSCPNFPSGIYARNIAERPTISYNGATGVAMAAWDVIEFRFNTTVCNLLGQAEVQVSVSTNDGVTWSAPKNVSGVSQTPDLGFTSASTHTWWAVFGNYGNGTAGTEGMAYSRSTNNGTTWSKATQISNADVNYLSFAAGGAASPDAFNIPQVFATAIDTNPTSAHLGSVYTVWTDNQSGTYAGYAAVEFKHTTNGGTIWSGPATLTNGKTTYKYFEPAVAVDPNGTVWVTYYGENANDGTYGYYGVFSMDGGATWSTQFAIADTIGTPGTGVGNIGLQSSLAATTNGVYPAWTDCRATDCSTHGNLSVYDANLHTVNITSNAPGLTAQVTEFAQTTPAPMPAWFGWETGATVSVQVPNSAPDLANSSLVWSFQHWSGLSTSTNWVTSFTYPGSGNLTAVYAAVQAGFIQGVIFPRVPGTVVTVDNQPLRLGTSYNASTWNYSYSAASGQSYFLNITAPNFYSPATQQLGVSPGRVTWFNWSLARVLGYVNGSVQSPAPSQLTINNTTTVPVGSNGIFSAHLAWGTYWYTAKPVGSASLTTSQSGWVQVYPRGSTPLAIVLSGGWVDGTVTTLVAGLRVALDGVAIPSNQINQGNFNQSLLGGTHHVTATAPGYNLTNDAITVTPGTSNVVLITLTNKGWIRGLIQPAAAAKGATMTAINATSGGGLAPLNASSGTFNFTERGGFTYHIQVSSTGYNPNSTYVAVSAGNASEFLTITMTPIAVKQNCTVTNTCTQTGNNSTSTKSTSAFPTTLVIGILAVVILAAVIAVVLVMRRRPPAGTPPEGSGYTEEAPAESVYGEQNPSELPKLQSDGSFGGPPQGPQ